MKDSKDKLLSLLSFESFSSYFPGIKARSAIMTQKHELCRNSRWLRGCTSGIMDYSAG